MKKIKLIKKLASLTLIGGAILVTLPLTIASCGCGTNVEPSISIDSNGDL
jgi:hypothetical protein